MINVKRFFQLSLGFSFFGDLVFIYSFYNMIFLEKGLSVFNLSLILITIQASKILFDIPTGIIADLKSRRGVLILGQISRIATYFLWGIFPSKANFFIGAIFWGLSMSCIYHHTEAYFFDCLKKAEKEHTFPKFMAKFYSVQNISISMASFLSSIIFAKTGHQGVFAFSILSGVASISILLKMPKHTIPSGKSENFGIANPLRIKEIFKKIIKSPNVLRLILLSSLVDALFILFIDLNTSIMAKENLSAKTIAYSVTAIGLFRVMTNYFSGYTSRFLSVKRVLNYLYLVLFAIIITTLFASFFLSLGIAFYLCIYPFFDNSIKTKLQNKIDSKTRATTLSMVSMTTSIIAICLQFFNGFVADKYGYRSSTIAIGITLLCSIALIRTITKIYKAERKIAKFIKKIKARF